MKSAQHIYNSVITNALYPPRITCDCAQHKALAKHYPQGEIAYYNKEMAILREKIVKEDNLIGWNRISLCILLRPQISLNTLMQQWHDG